MGEKILRAAVVYGFLLVAFRVMGKRQVGQLTPFDLTVLLIVSNVLQNAAIGNDNSVLGGIIGALTIFALNGLVALGTVRSRTVERLVNGRATRLVHNGEVDEAAMRRERITHEELHAALRDAGLTDPSEARFVVLEAAGHLTVGARRTP
ncbi:MAG: DUF421 domain-containing protein [Candidatus Binatia bacterium]